MEHPQVTGLDPFWSKVDIGGPMDCWEWRGARNGKGYGNFRFKSAHVVAFERAKGCVPAGLTIDHLCANRGCVNPAHLEAVTLQENIRRHASAITHCKRGHSLSGGNIRIVKRADGTRRKCLSCDRIYKAAAYSKKAGLSPHPNNTGEV